MLIRLRETNTGGMSPGNTHWRRNRTERVGGGFSSVNDVLSPTGNGTQNFMASYMLAEVLKYQYVKHVGPAWQMILMLTILFDQVPYSNAESWYLGRGVWP